MRTYHTNVDKAYELYLFSLLQFARVLKYAKRDADNRKRKHLLSEEDRKFTAKLATNELTVSLIDNEDFLAKIKKYKLAPRIEADDTRRLYQEFSQTEDYKTYIQQEDLTSSDHQKMLLSLFKFCVSNDSYNEVLEDFSPYWKDDKSLVVGNIKKTIRSLPAEGQFLDAFRPMPETTVFGEELLRYTYHDDKELMELIEPMLKNWDADRLAIIDLLLLKMALVEMLQFPTIPTNVTLNEFVDISKLYSTDKSKDFINGILDRLMKKLDSEGKIQKQSRRN